VPSFYPGLLIFGGDFSIGGGLLGVTAAKILLSSRMIWSHFLITMNGKMSHVIAKTIIPRPITNPAPPLKSSAVAASMFMGLSELLSTDFIH
jgi:hypothetical protein